VSQEIVRIADQLQDGGGRILLEGFPDVGLVGVIAVSYLVDKLQLKQVGYVDSELLPSAVAVHDSEVREIVRIYSNDVLVAVISEIPLPASLVRPAASSLLAWCKAKKIHSVISLGGFQEPNRLDIEVPKVFVVASQQDFREQVAKKTGAQGLKDGFITGLKAELLREGVRREHNVALLLAPAHYNYPDPGAAAQVVLNLSKLIGREIDVGPLLESAEEVKIRLRDLMRRTSESMHRTQKGREMEAPSIYV